jgi:riboflavin synthase
MFTGIVEERGRIGSITDGGDATTVTIETRTVIDGLAVGDSVSVDGACLTVTDVEDGAFSVHVVPETRERTTIGDRGPGDAVNLERAMPANGRFDGHIVQGHVDGTGVVESVASQGDGVRMAIDTPAALGRYLVEKGSVTVDGVSLTVAAVTDGGFEVALIPHTLKVTTLGERRSGDRVNLEADILAKYVERMMEART